VFSSNGSGHGQVYVVKVDGTGMTRLTDGEASDLSPEWSPDGGSIFQ
jgi:Tol biopolymer transport system component